MPTHTDPVQDAMEASAALRGLAAASRSFPRPVEVYPTLSEVTARLGSMMRVLDQLAAAHIDARERAHNTGGSQSGGATSALAAADELHQAATLLHEVRDRLDAAMERSGRIVWQPAPEPPDVGAGRTSVEAGALRLTVWPDESLGRHHRYGYLIENPGTGQSLSGRDLFTGFGAPVAPDEALRQLALLLGAAGTQHQNSSGHPAPDGMFPGWVAEAALVSTGELASLTRPTLGEEPVPPRRWVGVVFLQGSDAEEVLELIERDGPDAGVEHLSQWDFGDETTSAALENGYVYTDLPSGALDQTVTQGGYVLTYNHDFGYASLLREHHTPPDSTLTAEAMTPPAAVFPRLNMAGGRAAGRGAVAAAHGTTATSRATGAGAAAGAVAGAARGAEAAPDWFARQPGAVSPGQGRAL
ncbi:hypothetical protein [Microbacterium sp. JB110]|uniref:hypothetical protein n=1 Tax=Microbacterium sp. JB110 TaxID=2024477 RepID=UPI00097EF241|nr:hypothetical protein [Microbacterium sp. JB110]SJM53408.1 hypothetical protein CZ774_06180 [Frigoribacterium sp. JB110]